MNKVDIVICTKNRPKLLSRLINQVKLFSYNQLIIIDSSDTPFKFKNHITKQITYIYNPKLKLGNARQIGLKKCSSKYVFFVDDKVILSSNCVSILYAFLENSEDINILAVSGKMIIGYNDSILNKLFSCSKPFLEGENGGFVLLKRKEILEIGGFNKKIHYGEDVELHQRLSVNGKKWVLIPEATASYKISFKEILDTMKRHGYGCREASIIGNNMLKMAIKIIGRIFIMPLYYGFKTKDFRVFGYYSLMNLYLLFGFCRG